MKPLCRNILILLSYSFFAACPMAQPGAPGGTDGSRALTGSPGSGLPGPAGATGPEEGAAGGGVLPTGDDSGGNDSGSGAGTISDTPITVTGSPLGTMPKPGCTHGTKVYFDEVKTAMTGKKDELNRTILQVKGRAYVQWGPNGSPEGLDQTYTRFFDPSPPEPQWLGETKVEKGCFFAEVRFPETAVGKTLHLMTGLFVCNEDPVADHGGKLQSKKGGGRPEATWLTASYDLTLPASTEETSLDPCPSPKPPVRPVMDVPEMLTQ